MAKLAPSKKSDNSEDVFKKIDIEGYTIKPWTLTQFVNLAPVLKQIAESLKEKGIDVSKIDLQDFDLNKDLTVAGIEITGPVLPYLIAVSVRIKVEEAEEIEWGPSLAIVARIIQFNWNHIKNWLGQILGRDPNQILANLKTAMTD